MRWGTMLLLTPKEHFWWHLQVISAVNATNLKLFMVSSQAVSSRQRDGISSGVGGLSTVFGRRDDICDVCSWAFTSQLRICTESPRTKWVSVCSFILFHFNKEQNSFSCILLKNLWGNLMESPAFQLTIPWYPNMPVLSKAYFLKLLLSN